ncbi:MAG: hypothetical protein LBN24_11880 [Mediterranea sp.]|jgi:cytochrome c-type biogenesis protein CcmH/NrfG|nr:hypothetical protein [Mediterranea sp.]
MLPSASCAQQRVSAAELERQEMHYWIDVDKESHAAEVLAEELAKAYRENRNYDKAYLFYKELLMRTPADVPRLEACAEMQVRRGKEKDAVRMYEQILTLDADNLTAGIFLGNYYYLQAEYPKARDLLRKVLARFPSTGARQTLERIDRMLSARK